MRLKNKGFSLVELIVVILIMGILAVALAPSVTKYVSKANVAAALDSIMTINRAFDVALVELGSTGVAGPKGLGVQVGNASIHDPEGDKLTKILENSLTTLSKEEYLIIVTIAPGKTIADGERLIMYEKGGLDNTKPFWQYSDGKLTRGTTIAH